MLALLPIPLPTSLYPGREQVKANVWFPTVMWETQMIFKAPGSALVLVNFRQSGVRVGQQIESVMSISVSKFQINLKTLGIILWQSG